MLRRETAVELPITPSKLGAIASTDAAIDSSISNVNEQTSPILQRNASGDRQYSRTSTSSHNYLIPSMTESNQTRFKKSIESLPKNSSSETEYSLQPYRIIKQSSNETNTSLTGSFNIDQSFGGHETSIDTNDISVQNITVIENAATATGTKPKVLREMSTEAGTHLLKKQFSIDHSSNIATYHKLDSFDNVTSGTNGSPGNKNLKLPTINTIPATPTKLLTGVSSSTSTDESKDERNIPIISTNTVQDEIAKLSSNISSSSATDENNTDLPFNETMC